jgi:flavin reductase (DIM6/NTAB) family NADH-FMN oxidoreductase RutF
MLMRNHLANNLQEMWDCDNHHQIQCQDHEIVDAQVYHSDHHKDQALLKMQLSFYHYHLLECPQEHIFDGV